MNYIRVCLIFEKLSLDEKQILSSCGYNCVSQFEEYVKIFDMDGILDVNEIVIDFINEIDLKVKHLDLRKVDLSVVNMYKNLNTGVMLC